MIRIPLWGRLPSFVQVNLLNQHKSTIKPYIYIYIIIYLVFSSVRQIYSLEESHPVYTHLSTHTSHRSELSESLSLSVGQPGHCPSHIRVTGYCLGSRASARLIINRSDEKIGVFDRLWGFCLYVCAWLCGVFLSVISEVWESHCKSILGGSFWDRSSNLASLFTSYRSEIFKDITFCQENRKFYNLKSISWLLVLHFIFINGALPLVLN